MTTDAELREMVRRLNEHCFREVWNEVSAEERVNIRLTPVGTRFLSGSAVVGLETVALPAAGLFGVYLAPYQLFYSGLPIAPDVWFSAKEVLDQYGTLLSAYPPSGRLLSRSHFFVRRISRSNRVLVAMERDAMAASFGPAYRDPLYLTAYRDSDADNPISATSVYISPVNTNLRLAAVQTALETATAASAPGTTLLINGIERAHDQPYAINVGDYVEVICDRNVVAAYDVDVSNNTTAFYSVRDQRYKEVLHCPKALNPEQKLITHNTCTLFVRCATKNEGRYLHRVDPASVGQLTHTDLAVDRGVVEALRDEMGEQSVVVRVQMRVHSKDNVLSDELSYLKYLYTLDDATIVRFLRGQGDSELAFWSAAELEQSGYIALMFDVPNAYDPEVMSRYITSLGYYTVASLLANHQRSFTLDGSGYFELAKPYVLLGVDTTPLVYINGLKLRNDRLRYADLVGGRLGVMFQPGVYHDAGAQASVCLVETGTVQPTLFVPSLATPTITVYNRKVEVYEEVVLESPISGYGRSSDRAYKLVLETAGTLMFYPTENGGTQVVCGPSLYGKRLLIQGTRFCTQFTTTVDSVIEQGRPFVVPLTVACANDLDTVVPLLGERTLEVYVNGYRLTNNVDYTAIPAVAEGGRVLYDVVIGAMEYFSDAPNNTIEVVAHTATTFAVESGFVVDNKISYDRNLNLWYSGLSRAFVGGKLLHEPINHGGWLEPRTTEATGAPYVVHTTLSANLADALSLYSPQVDNMRQSAINRYFNRNPPPDPAIIINPHSHRLYSPYLAAIIADLLDRSLVVADDPIDKRFLAQFAGYAYLKERDAALTKPGGVITKSWVDVNAQYRIPAVSDVTLYRIIQRLSKLTLGNDTDTIGDIYS